MRRKPLRSIGRRKKREQEAEAANRKVVLARAGEWCERCGTPCEQLQVHHKLPRSRGGGHTLDNCSALCPPCHRAIHDHVCDDWREWVR